MRPDRKNLGNFDPKSSEGLYEGVEGRKENLTFRMEGWGYKRRDLGSLIHALSRGERKTAQELEACLRRGGGKAFGLKICERIVSNFGHPPYKLSVPSWEIIEDIDAFELSHAHSRSILRSSAPMEDWLDRRSGVLDSFNFMTDGWSWEKFRKKHNSKELPRVPYVLQEEKIGFGIVADIAFSPLLGRAVVKIAAGNVRAHAGTGSYTSATRDIGASVGVWDASTGQPVVATVNFGYESLFAEGEMHGYPFVKALVDAVKKSGVFFGAQLEMIVNPHKPEEISLVQIRPTPENTYRRLQLPNSEKARENSSDPLWRSPVVNAAFDFTGTAEFLDPYDAHDRFCTGSASLEASVYHRLGRGKVGLYYMPHEEDTGYSFFDVRYQNAAEVYYGGYLEGSEVQITSSVIGSNSRHKSIDLPEDVRNLYDELDKKCGMVFLSNKDILEVRDKLWSEGGFLRVASDGLIAEIRVVERSM